MKTKKKVVENALEVAQDVAQLIFDYSYKAQDMKIDDLLLFGSTLSGEAHDIDLLIIHQFYPLTEFGKFTKYQDGQGLVLDFDAKIENGRYKASRILRTLGSPEFQDQYSAENEIMEDSRAEIAKIRNDEDDYEDDCYSGIITLPYLGKVVIDKTKYCLGVLDTIENLFKEKCEQRMVVEKVKKFLADKNLEVDEVLDLHVMDCSVLSAEGEMDRMLAIQQSRDPSFWYTVLSTGRLYDQKEGTFSIPVTQKYPEAVELFNPTR